MATDDPSEPGEVRDTRERGSGGRLLEQAPSRRYEPPGGTSDGGSRNRRGSLLVPLAQAALVAAIGAALLFLVGAVVASTVGLMFVCGVTGAAIGLVLSRATVDPDGASPPLTRGAMTGLAIGIALGAVVLADIATWAYALREGGTLGLFEYLFETFGPFVPGELLAAALGALWGASSGPIQRP